MSHSFSRRAFLGATAAGAGAVLFSDRFSGRSVLAGEGGVSPELPPVAIHTIYVGKRGAAWPKPAFDPRAEMAKFEKPLADAATELGDVKFVGGELVQTPDEAANLAARLKDADAVLVMHLSLNTLPELQALVDAGRPTVVFSQPFSGHEWMFVNNWRKGGKRVCVFATSDHAELARAAALLRVPARMRQSRIVLIGPADGTPAARSAEQVRQRLGTQVVPVAADRLIEAHKAVDPKLAEAEAEQYWLRAARKVIEPSREEVIKSARMYFAMASIMAAERAQAITIRCLGGIPIDVIGYPCLGFSKLLDRGLVGACEADMDSTLTMLMFRYAFGVPGFITDPLFDTAKNAVIHAHCTAPTRMDGPAGPRAPFTIRTHRDDDKGAALEVEMKVGQTITCAKLVNLDTMLVSTGRIIEIPDIDDRGCRTQITTEVADARRMLDNFGAGLVEGWVPQLHRVVFYGDHMRDVQHLGALMGFKVLEAI